MFKNQRKAGVILNYVSITLNMIIGLSYTPFLLKMLGQSEYGIYSLAASIIAYLTVLDLGFGNAIVRYTAKFRAEGKYDDLQYMFGMFIILYIVIGIVALIIGSILTFNVEKMFVNAMTDAEIGRTRIALGLMTLNLTFTFPLSIWGSIMNAYEQFVFKRLFTIARNILNPIVMIILLLYGYKAIALVVVTTVFNLLSLTADCIFCKFKLKIKVKYGQFNWTFLKEVAIYSIWIFFNAIIDRIYWSTGQFVLGIVRGTAAVAVYAVAVQLHSFFLSFSTAISSVFLPKITEMTVKGEGNNRISDIFIKTGRLQFVVMSYILSGFIVFGRPFINIWAGNEYDEAYFISLLFFVPLIIPLIQTIGLTILQARNQMKFRSLLYLSISVFSFVISIPMAKMYGGIGCAVVTCVAIFIGHGIVMNIYYQKKQGVDILQFWKNILKMSVSPIALTGIAYYFASSSLELYNFDSLLKYGVVYSFIYFLFFWIFSLNKYERTLVTNILKKK